MNNSKRWTSSLAGTFAACTASRISPSLTHGNNIKKTSGLCRRGRIVFTMPLVLKDVVNVVYSNSRAALLHLATYGRQSFLHRLHGLHVPGSTSHFEKHCGSLSMPAGLLKQRRNVSRTQVLDFMSNCLQRHSQKICRNREQTYSEQGHVQQTPNSAKGRLFGPQVQPW